MKRKTTPAWLLAGALVGALSLSAAAPAAIVTFDGNGGLDNDWDPFDEDATVPTSITEDGLTLTSRDFTDAGAGGSLETNGDRIGIDRAGGGESADRFDDGEFWVIDLDSAVEFVSLGLNQWTSLDEFTLQSDDWIGESYTPNNIDITYNSVTGTFTFQHDAGTGTATSGSGNTLYDLDDLTSGSTLSVASGVDWVFTDSNNGDSWQILSLSVNTVVIPEPASLALLSIGGLLIAGRTRRKH